MASIQQRGERFQLRVVHKLLPRPFFFTFDTRGEAETYGTQLEAMLQRGVVPVELAEQKPTEGRKDHTPWPDLLGGYLAEASVAPSEVELVKLLARKLKGVRVHQSTYAWVEAFVKECKVKENLAPGTIRKRVGSLARALDWHHRKTTGRDQVNPFRLLPLGYSTYSVAESELVQPKVDVQRDRRLLPEEEARIRQALAGVKREDRERALWVDPAMAMMFDLMLDTGLRLSEAFRLQVSAFDEAKGILRVAGSKGHRGRAKPRVVPLKPALRVKLKSWCEGRVGLMFPFWDGSPEGRARATSALKGRFGTLFAYAKVEDFTTHDLRHEAACRWFELRDGQGRWALSDVEVCKVMGWSSLSLALRYASIRGEDLVARIEHAYPV